MSNISLHWSIFQVESLLPMLLKVAMSLWMHPTHFKSTGTWFHCIFSDDEDNMISQIIVSIVSYITPLIDFSGWIIITDVSEGGYVTFDVSDAFQIERSVNSSLNRQHELTHFRIAILIYHSIDRFFSLNHSYRCQWKYLSHFWCFRRFYNRTVRDLIALSLTCKATWPHISRIFVLNLIERIFNFTMNANKHQLIILHQ